jgi:ribosomal protein S12 methylthiotransferase
MKTANKIRLSLISLGCPKNLADLEAVVSQIKNAKLTSEKKAKIILLNTCGFLKIARDEVFENLKNLKNKRVIILGCLASHFTKEVLKKYPQIYAVVSSANYKNINAIVKKVAQNKRITAIKTEPKIFENPKGKTLLYSRPYAYIKIAEGCNNRCAYCLIPSLKGAFRSRKPEDIISEAKVLISKGIKEIILVAQDCGCYPNLPKLLKNLSRIPGDFWIRVLYIYPERITDELIKTIKNSPKICHYLDIPLQHGDPKILHSMRRQSNIAETLKKISKIRKIIPDIALRTSIITGFPGEDKKAFENLKKFIKKISFDHVGVFEYSREKGTPAYDFPNQISDKEKRRRKKILMLLQQKISLNKNKSLLGKTTKVLIENYDAKAGFYIARSQKFAPEIDGVIFVKSKVPLQKSSFITTKITKTLPYDLISETF